MAYALNGLVLACLGGWLANAPAWAQNAENSALVAQHKAAFVRQVKARQLLRDPDWYYRYQVDVTKEQQLRKAGLDLAVLDKRAGPGTYQENLLYTTTVVRGSVISQQYDERPEVYFHSLYEVKVAEVLAGHVTSTVLTVRLRGGRVGDAVLHTSHEPTLQPGEQVLLYLNPIDTEELASAKAQGFWNFTNNASPADFSLVDKYCIKAGYVFDAENNRLAKVAAVQAAITRLVGVLDRDSFAQKTFE